MKLTFLNCAKKLVGYLIIFSLIVTGAVMIYQQYPKMNEQVKKVQEPYFETWCFNNRLIEGSYHLASVLGTQKLMDDENVENFPYSEYSLNRYPDELDYYAINLKDSSVMEREGSLLKQIVESSEDAMFEEELKSRYQFVVELLFDEAGVVHIEALQGANRQVFESVLAQVLTNEEVGIQNMKVAFGIPNNLQMGGAIYEEMMNHQDDYYVILSIPYLIIGALVAMLVTFMIPYAWIRDFGWVKGLLVVPLEIRFLFVLGTIFAIMGAPFLILSTQRGLLAEMVAWYMKADHVQLMVDFINILCWSGFIFVIAIHSLYVKEFFMIGPWKMIRRHTLIGQLIGLVRKRPEVQTLVEEKVVYQEAPESTLLKAHVVALVPQLEQMQGHLQKLQLLEDQVALETEITELYKALDEVIHLVEQEPTLNEVNLTKVIANCLTMAPDAFHQLDLKTKMPNERVKVISHEKQLSSILDQLLGWISRDAIGGSRCYLELIQTKKQIEFIIRYVTVEEGSLTTEEQEAIQLRFEMLGGSFDYVRDGDLIKWVMTFTGC